MKEIKGSIEIDAPVDRVWGAVTDFSSYSEWNPWIISMIGELNVGNACDVTTRPPGKGATRFKSRLDRVDDGKELLFKAKYVGGLLTSDHVFAIESLGPEKTRFFQSVVFEGVLVPLAGGTIDASQKGLEEMNAALKEICEKKE